MMKMMVGIMTLLIFTLLNTLLRSISVLLANELINAAPSFKDLLEAIMEERRNGIRDSDTYKFIECTIKEKCEEAARELKTSILLGEVGLINNSLFKTMKYKFSSPMLLDSIYCICRKLELEFDGREISWGGTNALLPKL